jgi:WD40 repeat protein
VHDHENLIMENVPFVMPLGHFTSDQRSLLASIEPPGIVLMDLYDSAFISTLPLPDTLVHPLALDWGTGHGYGYGRDNMWLEWNLDTGRIVRSAPLPISDVFPWYRGPVVSEENSIAAIITTDYLTSPVRNEIALWNIANFEPTWFPDLTSVLPENRMHTVSDISQNGRYLVTDFIDPQNWYNTDEIIWDTVEQEVVVHLAGREGGTFSPNDRQIASIDSASGEIIVWDAETHDEIARFEISDKPFGVTWLQQDRLFVQYNDYTFELIDAVSGEVVQRFVGQDSGVEDIRLTTTLIETTLFTGDRSGWLVMWNAQTGEEIRRVRVTEDRIVYLDVNPSGQLVVFTAQYPGIDGKGATNLNATRWDSRVLNNDELMSWTCNNRYIRNLTCQERMLYLRADACDISTED